MVHAMLRFRYLLDPDYTVPKLATEKPNLAEDEAAAASVALGKRNMIIRLKLPRTQKKACDLNCKKIDGIGKENRVMKTQNPNSTPLTAVKSGNMCSGNTKAIVGGKRILESNSSLEKPKIKPIAAVNYGSGNVGGTRQQKKLERLDEAKYQEKFEATKRKYVEVRKQIIKSRKNIKMVEFKDLPKQSRLATTGTKKYCRSSLN